MRRLVLLLATGVFGFGLALGDRHRAGARPETAPSADTLPFDPGGRCPTNPAYPARTEVVVLPPTSSGYGSIQYPRTPLEPRTVALTFDDGPSAVGDPEVFRILAERCIEAVFFHVGVYARMRPDLVQEAVRRGHGVASHSWSHPTTLPYWSQTSARAEVERGLGSLTEAAGPQGGVEPFFRFPGLNDSPALRGWLAGRGYTVIGAEAGADDWRPISAAQIHARAVANLEQTNGGVLILHQTRPNMIRALPGLLDDLNGRGFRFVRISAGRRA